MQASALLFLLSLATLCGCMPKMVAYPGPTIFEANESPDDLYAAAVRVFLRRGWGFQQSDPMAHAAETNWVTFIPHAFGSSMGVLVSYRILIGPGRVEIFTSCKLQSDGGLDRGPCPQGQRPTGLAESEQALFRDIVVESKSIATANTTVAAPSSSKASTTPHHDATACTSNCSKDRQSCFHDCGRSDKCKESCAEGYVACTKSCSQ